MEKFQSGEISAEDVLTDIAKHYQYGANMRPFNHINNSLFMNEVNTYLQITGLPKMTQGEYLDHAAQRMQPENFVNYFIDYYKSNHL